MSKLKEYLEGRQGLHLTKKTNKEYSSPCPWCQGRDRFQVFIDEDRYWCRQCGKHGDYIQILMELENLDFKDAAAEAGKVLTPIKPRSAVSGNVIPKSKISHPSHGKPDHVYDYTTADGKLLYRVCRWDIGPTRDKKVISQVTPNGAKWGMENLEPVLYNMGDVNEHKLIFIVEGEKCVEAVRRSGLAATTTPGGSSAIDSLVERFDILAPLEGKSVAVVPDQDEVGEKYAEAVCSHLSDKGIPSKIVSLPPSGKKGYDVADYLSETDPGTLHLTLVDRYNSAHPYEKKKPLMTMDELIKTDFVKKVDVIKDVLPDGGHLLVAGEAGVGKSILRTELALHIAYGRNWLDLEIPQAKRVAILQWENTRFMEQKRLKRQLAGMGVRQSTHNLVFADNTRRWDLSRKSDQKGLESFVKSLDVDVVVYDCLSNIHTSKENDNIKMREVLDTLSDINNKLGLTCVVIHHFGKPNEMDLDDKYRIRGASSVIDWAVTAVTYTSWADDAADFLVDYNKHEAYRKLAFVKLRDAPPRPPAYCKRNKDTLLLEHVNMFGDLISNFIKEEHEGSYEEGGDKFVRELMQYMKMARTPVRKLIRAAVLDGHITEEQRGNKKIYKAETIVDVPKEPPRPKQETFKGWR